jgi:phosphoglycolate phosphatase-like HAD superfamily hydrolase
MTHVILDCDDVLLDWQVSFVSFMADQGVMLNPLGPDSWDLSEWMGMPSGACRRWIEIFNASHHFTSLKATDGAKAVVTALKTAGHESTVLTSCGTDRDVMRGRHENLRSQFGSRWVDPFKEVIFLPLGASKLTFLRKLTARHNDVVFVEDNYTHALAGVEAGATSYCLRRSHNRSQEQWWLNDGVIWVDSIADFHEHFSQRNGAQQNDL